MIRNETLTAWYQAGRAPFFVATFIPLILGGVCAYKFGEWHPLRWLVVLAASFFVHLATNLANDYFDDLTGADAGDSIGGSRVLQEGKITVRQIMVALYLLYGTAAVCGIWIVAVSQVWRLIPLVMFAFLSSVFYTAPPIMYGYRGLGEVFVGINMGPVMVVGCAAAVAGGFVPISLWVSIPVAIMVAMILYYQSLPDMDADRAVGKRTLSVRLGPRRAVWGMRAFFAGALISIAVLGIVGTVHPIVYLCAATIVPAYQTDRMIRGSADWKELHDRGGKVRLFYVVNGIILTAGTAMG